MKKIFLLLVFALGVSFSVSAQDNAKALKTQAKEQVKTLTEYLNLDSQNANEIYNVLIEKNALTINPSTARRNIGSEEVDLKLRELLNKRDYLKLLENKDLYTKLLN